MSEKMIRITIDKIDFDVELDIDVGNPILFRVWIGEYEVTKIIAEWIYKEIFFQAIKQYEINCRPF